MATTQARRAIRSAPTERPAVSISPGLRERIGQIAQATEKAILEALGAENLPGRPEEFQGLEERLLKVCRGELVGAVLSEVLEAIHASQEFVLWSMRDARRREDLGSRGDRAVSVRVGGGREVAVTTPYMSPLTPRGEPGRPRRRGSRGEGGGGLYPVLAALGFVCDVSPYVASLTALTAALVDSHEEAVDTLGQHGLKMDVDTVRRIVARVADAGIVAREQGEPGDPTALAGKRVVVGIDGGRLRYRIPKAGRPRKSGRHGYSTPWREPKVVTIYTVDEEGKMRPGEKPIYEGTLAPWDDAISLIASTLERNGAKDAELLAIAADGSDNIWRDIDRLVVGIGIDPSRVAKFVDFCHVVEHLSAAAKLVSNLETDQQRQQWTTKLSKRLKKGHVEEVIHTLEAAPTASKKDREALESEIEYCRKRIDMMRYHYLKQRGLPIGSGAVESAIRRIVNLRLKNPGTFWRPDNAERMLYLRCRAKAGRWAEVEAALYRAARRPARSVVPEIFPRLTE
ncbi:MAG: hypothetical protein AB1778_07785 [Candidatus Bipolaricaulota bacterium]